MRIQIFVFDNMFKDGKAEKNRTMSLKLSTTIYNIHFFHKLICYYNIYY